MLNGESGGVTQIIKSVHKDDLIKVPENGSECKATKTK